MSYPQHWGKPHYSIVEERRKAGWLKVQEVANLIGRSPDSVLRWAKAGKFVPMFQTAGEYGWFYFQLDDVEEWARLHPEKCRLKPQD